MSCIPGFVLSARDVDVLRTLRTNLRIENRVTFSADDVFLFGLDRFFEDKVHGVGGFFAKLQHLGKIEAVGRKRSVRPSNHLREIRVYAFVSNQDLTIHHHRMPDGALVSCPGGAARMRFYDVYFWCTKGQHRVRKETAVVDGKGVSRCPVHKKMLRTRSLGSSETRDRLYPRSRVA